MLKFIKRIKDRYMLGKILYRLELVCLCSMCGKKGILPWVYEHSYYNKYLPVFVNKGGRDYVFLFCSEECKKKFWDNHSNGFFKFDLLR